MPPASQLEDPVIREAFADAYAGGMTKADMMQTFGISRPTVNKWLQDPRVQQHASKAIQDRVERMLRIIDSELEQRLSSRHLKNMDTDTLLRIRKEVMDKAVKVDVNQTVSVSPMAMWKALDANPEALTTIEQALIEGTAQEVSDDPAS